MKENEISEGFIYLGDCKEVLNAFPNGSADLIYVDPPFFSNGMQGFTWDDNIQLSEGEGSWIQNIRRYMKWIKERIERMFEVLSASGSFYLHCNLESSHYLKAMLDGVVGHEKFVNRIIWKYAEGKRRIRSKGFQRCYDCILFYTKGEEYTFNNRLLAPKENVQEENAEKFTDVWTDIQKVYPSSEEYLDYPTQKPVALLERIIKISSNEGDLVTDPMFGSGTTLEAAEKSNRRWVGIDKSPIAHKITKERLNEKGIPVNESIETQEEEK